MIFAFSYLSVTYSRFLIIERLKKSYEVLLVFKFYLLSLFMLRLTLDRVEDLSADSEGEEGGGIGTQHHS
jgi:hypothetical protein